MHIQERQLSQLLVLFPAKKGSTLFCHGISNFAIIEAIKAVSM